jgi:hypothetical protein
LGFNTYIHRNVTIKHSVELSLTNKKNLTKTETRKAKQVLSGGLAPVQGGGYKERV